MFCKKRVEFNRTLRKHSLFRLNSVSSQCARGKSSITQNNVFSGKKILKNVTQQIFYIILVSSLVRVSHCCNIKFALLFVLLNAVIKIASYGDFFFFLFNLPG